MPRTFRCLMLSLMLILAACAPKTAPVAPAEAPQATAAPVVPPAPVAAPSGFAGIPWEASAKSVSGLTAYDADTALGVTTYLWPQGPRDIAGAPMRDAFYEFYQDRFYHVWIDFDGFAAYKAALAWLTGKYGPPSTENPEKYYHAWTLGDVNIYCAFHQAENGGDVSFFYQPVYERLAAARKAGPVKPAKPAGPTKPAGPAKGKTILESKKS